jgi:hypothetical protein
MKSCYSKIRLLLEPSSLVAWATRRIGQDSDGAVAKQVAKVSFGTIQNVKNHENAGQRGLQAVSRQPVGTPSHAGRRA